MIFSPEIVVFHPNNSLAYTAFQPSSEFLYIKVNEKISLTSDQFERHKKRPLEHPPIDGLARLPYKQITSVKGV